MTKLAAPLLGLSLLGLASLFVPGPNGTLFGLYAEFDRPRVTLLVLAFGGVAITSALAMRRPRPWYAYVALGGFVFALVKSRLWALLPQLGDAPAQLTLHAIAIAGGTVLGLVAAVLGADARARRPTS